MLPTGSLWGSGTRGDLRGWAASSGFPYSSWQFPKSERKYQLGHRYRTKDINEPELAEMTGMISPEYPK